MNEGEYLEMVNQLKEKFDENEQMMNVLVEENNGLKKEILTAYGLCRVIDNLLQDQDVDMELKVLSSSMRSILSEVYDTLITQAVILKLPSVGTHDAPQSPHSETHQDSSETP